MERRFSKTVDQRLMVEVLVEAEQSLVKIIGMEYGRSRHKPSLKGLALRSVAPKNYIDAVKSIRHFLTTGQSS